MMVATPPRPAPGGYIFKFVPDRPGDLTSGQLYALKIVAPTGDRIGEAVWIPLDRAAVQIDADAAATAAEQPEAVRKMSKWRRLLATTGGTASCMWRSPVRAACCRISCANRAAAANTTTFV
jgi:hypothetical protein